MRKLVTALLAGGAAATTLALAPTASADPSGCQQGWGVRWCDGPLRADGTWVRCAEQPWLSQYNPAKRACYVLGAGAPPAPFADIGAPPGHMAVEPGVPQ